MLNTKPECCLLSPELLTKALLLLTIAVTATNVWKSCCQNRRRKTHTMFYLLSKAFGCKAYQSVDPAAVEYWSGPTFVLQWVTVGTVYLWARNRSKSVCGYWVLFRILQWQHSDLWWVLLLVLLFHLSLYYVTRQTKRYSVCVWAYYVDWAPALHTWLKVIAPGLRWAQISVCQKCNWRKLKIHPSWWGQIASLCPGDARPINWESERVSTRAGKGQTGW